jgi:hypothetical protein
MKLDTDTKMVLVGAVVVGLGLWYVKRQVSSAVSGAVDGVTGAVGEWAAGVGASMNAAMTAIGSGAKGVADVVAPSYTDPKTGDFYPYGTVPSNFQNTVPWYLGASGVGNDQFDTKGGYIGASLWTSPTAPIVSGGGGSFLGNGASGAW